jgi:hypothetical protein
MMEGSGSVSGTLLEGRCISGRANLEPTGTEEIMKECRGMVPGFFFIFYKYHISMDGIQTVLIKKI